MKKPNPLPTQPLVSIIVPIYNTARYLPACLDSIIAQTHQNLEIILIDDGSTDHSGQIANNYAKKDSRIKVIHQKNQGQSAARNLGLTMVKGEYVSFLDSDDEIKPTFIKELLAPIVNSNASLSVCGMHYKRLKTNTAENVYISQLRPRRKPESLKAYILYLLAIDGRMYSSVNKLYRAKIATKLRFDTKLNFAEDTKFVLDYLAKASGDPVFVLSPLYIYNFGTETSTINSTAIQWKNWQTAYQNLKSWLSPHPSAREKFWLHLVRLRWHISFLRSKRRAKP
ncbi:glycosyltransferase family 2 protein [Candidatus Saccharibacteria bacterium]|nr:glycosyltransferase family 2 protein [Candidatus Saccharibacteria bacterium]